LQKGERIVIDGLQSIRPSQVIVPENVAMERNQGTQDIAASVGK
jgi:hypothetical protein